MFYRTHYFIIGIAFVLGRLFLVEVSQQFFYCFTGCSIPKNYFKWLFAGKLCSELPVPKFKWGLVTNFLISI